MRRAFLQGYVHADGALIHNRSWRVVSSSRELICDVRDLALTCGIRPAKILTQKFASLRPPNSKQPLTDYLCHSVLLAFVAELEAEGATLLSNAHPDPKHIRYERIRAITQGPVKAVYDLTVEGTESFVAEGFLVHNTRWHEDDLVGRLLQRAAEDPKADQWEVICFRAIREDDENPDDPREVGEALWPEEYPLEELEKTRASMSEADFSGLYQQRPNLGGKSALPEHRWSFWYRGPEPPPVIAKNEDGDLIECKQERLPESFDYQYQSWDMSFKDLATSDWVVGQVHAAKGARDYLLDQIRDRWDFSRTQAELRLLTENHPRTRQKLIEDKANGPAVISAAKLTIPGILPITPEGGKEARVNAISYLHEAGNLFIPHPSEASWVRGFIQECSQFPRGRYDDQVDAYSQAINWRFHGRRKKKWSKVRVAYG